MLTYRFPVIIKGRWNWVRHVSNHGNKYEAVQEYTRQQAARGTVVQGHDMSQSSSYWTRDGVL